MSQIQEIGDMSTESGPWWWH